MATHKVTSFLKGVREYVYPVLQSSAFLERGVLTPQEFVAAGDQLVYRCPTWSWEAGDPSKAKSYLPPDKQFLVTRNVPCHRRATAFAREYVAETEVKGFDGSADDGEGWLATHVAPPSSSSETNTIQNAPGVLEEVDLGSTAAVVASLPEGAVLVDGHGQEEEEEPGATVLLAPGMVTVVDEHFGAGGAEEEGVTAGAAGAGTAAPVPAASAAGAAASAAPTARAGGKEEEDDMAGYADLASYEEAALAAGAAEDEAVLTSTSTTTIATSQQQPHGAAPLPYLRTEEPEAPTSALLAARTYDISITYDKYYQTPRAWLLGYDEEGQPLGQAALFEDIMQDYANRTVTVEAHPHTGLPQASIHPCQHANVMKNMVRNLSAGGDESRVPRVDQYLFIFLKFIQSVVPTIEYDFTIEIEGR